MSQLPEIRAEIAAAVRDVNRRLETGARVASFVTLPKELDADEAELTRSRKLRREQIAEHYREVIGAIYAGVEHVNRDHRGALSGRPQGQDDRAYRYQSSR